MHFSRLLINPQRREAKKLLSNPRAMHAAVEAAFPPGADRGSRVLWRVDRNGHEVVLYVVSPDRPDLRHIQEQAGWEGVPGQSTDYRRLLDSFQIGQRFAFRLAANPVKREFVAGGRGRILSHVTVEQQIEWLKSRSHGWGFALRPAEVDPEMLSDGAEAPLDVQVQRRTDHQIRKSDAAGTRTVTQREVVFTGRLEVTDAVGFRDALTRGMGRGKAYGLGLMTVAR